MAKCRECGSHVYDTTSTEVDGRSYCRFCADIMTEGMYQTLKLVAAYFENHDHTKFQDARDAVAEWKALYLR